MKKLTTPKAAFQTAPVRWYIGQALLPVHFETQEQSLRREMQARLQLLRAPYWGIGSIRWDVFQVPEGNVSLLELTLVLPSGELIDIPGNTSEVAVNLTAAGASAEVYLHVPERPQRDAVTTDGRQVDRMLSGATLSTEPVKAGMTAFLLAKFTGMPTKKWVLNEQYIPPMLQVRSDSPFFDGHLKRIRSVVKRLEQSLRTEAQEDYLSAANLSNRVAQVGLYNLLALLIDLDSGLTPHPYELFSALRTLYINCCIHDGAEPSRLTDLAYRHEQLGECFELMVQLLQEKALQGRSPVPYHEFTRRDGLCVCKLPTAACAAKEVFLLVQKSQASAAVDLSRIKLASESRIQDVYERSLRGIPFQRLDWVPFQHGLAAELEFYAISPGREWDYAVREGSVVLSDNKALEGVRFYLYWRND